MSRIRLAGMMKVGKESEELPINWKNIRNPRVKEDLRKRSRIMKQKILKARSRFWEV